MNYQSGDIVLVEQFDFYTLFIKIWNMLNQDNKKINTSTYYLQNKKIKK